MGSENTLERRICLAAGFCVLIFVMALIWRNTSFASPDLARMARIILSLGVGVLGGTIPGFLHVEYNLQGFVVRAGGALALFAITFFGSPNVEALKLHEPAIEVSSIPQVDIRTRAEPSKSDDERLNSEAVVTVPLSARNIEEPSRSGFLEHSRAELKIGGSVWNFDWTYFVNMHEEASGLWLAIQGSVAPQSLKSGDVLNKEIMYISSTPVRWGDILNRIQDPDLSRGELTAYYTFNGISFTQTCQFDAQRWGKEIKRFMTKTGKTPGRVTMNCEA